MATEKKSITIVKDKNSPKPITVTATFIETEVVDGRIVPVKEITNPGVKQ